MDNNDFEQQFTQNVKKTMPAKSATTTGDSLSKLPLVVAIVLGIVTLIESIILIVTLINFFQVVNPVEEEISVDVEEYDTIGDEDEFTGYNDNDELVWLNLTCTNEDSNSKYVFTKTKDFQQFKGSDIVNSGTYSIVNDTLVSLSGDGGKVLFYDGYSVADGLTIYDCDFDVEESVDTEE